MSTSTSKPNLLILGSGWAGYTLTSSPLSPALLQSYNVTLISPRRTAAFTPLLASAAVGLFSFSLAEEPIRAKSRKNLKFIKANVLAIDFKGKQVRCAPAFDDEDLELVAGADGGGADEFEVRYDFLVIAVGCGPHTFGTPGVAENAIFMKNVSDAMKVRKRLFDLLEMASLPSVSRERAKELLHVAIVGGGPTGIELTAELDDLCKGELRDLYPEVSGLVRISVYDVAPNILSAYDAKLHEYATAQLGMRGIEVAPNTRIERVGKGEIWIKDVGRVGCGMLIWATGNKHVELVEAMAGDVKLAEKGLKRVLTNTSLKVYKSGQDAEVWDGVWAVGDAADIEGQSLPTTAEVACQKARYLAGEFNKGGDRMFATPFEYQQKQLVSYIGQHDGVIAGKGPNDPGWTGRSAWLAWRGGSIIWNRNWRARLSIIITWILNAVLGKEIAKM